LVTLVYLLVLLRCRRHSRLPRVGVSLFRRAGSIRCRYGLPAINQGPGSSEFCSSSRRAAVAFSRWHSHDCRSALARVRLRASPAPRNVWHGMHYSLTTPNFSASLLCRRRFRPGRPSSQTRVLSLRDRDFERDWRANLTLSNSPSLARTHPRRTDARLDARRRLTTTAIIDLSRNKRP